ncbi:MAG: amidase, partial [Anaerolineales bacterium]|nr:amidase [Anaerolineales bacterium]
FCGLVGLKPTFGRVSEHGAYPLDWSVAHVGPIGASATDAALTYAIIAGPDPKDANSLHQPLPTLEGWDNLNLNGFRIGIYRPWFDHAEEKVVTLCDAMVKNFEEMGCEVREIVIPDLEANRVAHLFTIVSEMLQGLGKYYDKYHREHGNDVRVNLALGRQFSADDYVKAQRIRTRMIGHFVSAFKEVDVILTPTTAIAAPVIKKSALPDGDSDLTVLTEIMRFVTTANMTGHPAISFPVGYTQIGLPVGMQAIGRAWEEHQLLRMALAAEQVVERKTPQVHYPILGK